MPSDRPSPQWNPFTKQWPMEICNQTPLLPAIASTIPSSSLRTRVQRTVIWNIFAREINVYIGIRFQHHINIIIIIITYIVHKMSSHASPSYNRLVILNRTQPQIETRPSLQNNSYYFIIYNTKRTFILLGIFPVRQHHSVDTTYYTKYIKHLIIRIFWVSVAYFCLKKLNIISQTR